MYVPCLRTDDLVLKLHEPRTIERLRARHGCRRAGLRRGCGRRSAACSSGSWRRAPGPAPSACRPTSSPRRATPQRAVTPIRRAIHGMDLRPDEHEEIRCAVFWTLAEFCAEFRLPFDLMIGPIRNVYPGGRRRRPRPVRPPGQPVRLPRAVQPLRGRDLPGLDPLARRRRRAGGLRLDLPQRAADGALVVLERPGVHRRRPAGAAPGLAQGQAAWAIIQMPTSSNSSCPNSTCIRRVLADVLADDAIRGPGLVDRAGARAGTARAAGEPPADLRGGCPEAEFTRPGFDRGRIAGHP